MLMLDLVKKIKFITAFFATFIIICSFLCLDGSEFYIESNNVPLIESELDSLDDDIDEINDDIILNNSKIIEIAIFRINTKYFYLSNKEKFQQSIFSSRSPPEQV